MSFNFRFVDETAIFDDSSNISVSAEPAEQDSQSSENIIEVIKGSTPANSQSLYPEFFLPSQSISDITSLTSPKKARPRPKKFSKQEVLDLLKTFDNNMMAANSIMEQLTGRVFSDISSTDFEELQTTQELLRLVDM